ncbi:MAG: hypothetical protein M3Q84_10490, partial [Actinomycetota bacterium]|nr:hypothetical protein [Actinomycetota bacterium]
MQTFTERDLEQITADPPPWERRAVLHQRWSELAYFHWRYEAVDGDSIDTTSSAAGRTGRVPLRTSAGASGRPCRNETIAL